MRFSIVATLLMCTVGCSLHREGKTFNLWADYNSQQQFAFFVERVEPISNSTKRRARIQQRYNKPPYLQQVEMDAPSGNMGPNPAMPAMPSMPPVPPVPQSQAEMEGETIMVPPPLEVPPMPQSPPLAPPAMEDDFMIEEPAPFMNEAPMQMQQTPPAMEAMPPAMQQAPPTMQESPTDTQMTPPEKVAIPQLAPSAELPTPPLPTTEPDSATSTVSALFETEDLEALFQSATPIPSNDTPE